MRLRTGQGTGIPPLQSAAMHDPDPDTHYTPPPPSQPLPPGKQPYGPMPDQDPSPPQPHHLPEDPVTPEEERTLRVVAALDLVVLEQAALRARVGPW